MNTSTPTSATRIGALPPSDECISALLDGELEGAALALTIDEVSTDDTSCANWRLYRLAGEVLRTQAVGSAAQLGDRAFAQRVRQLIEAEAAQAQLPPMALHDASESIATTHRITPASNQKDWENRPAANDPVWRWRLAAAVASLVAVVSLGLQFARPSGDAGPGAPMATAGDAWVLATRAPMSARVTAPAPVDGATLGASGAVEARDGVVLRDPELDRFLAAHRPWGPGMGELGVEARTIQRVGLNAPVR
ncbi:sigma-E factor negative regulatory protein [Tibeticola sp.]|uniref:sigma-E factor negative regulatory protein n=1 Tax=Tibeticola sp. TaxID=2005368 RepID=UPI00258A9C5F|nr:sigma-E factor negative regulatory protein [Tibeticola sp.]MCI4440923.1 sigma-E factor negative regulatory protein [Tibeticola sp.]